MPRRQVVLTMNAKAKLSDLSMALESDGMEGEHVSRFDRETGEVAYVEADVLRSVEEAPDYEDSDMPDWPAQSPDSPPEVGTMRRAGPAQRASPNEADRSECLHPWPFLATTRL